MLYDARTDVVVCGHVHSYERTVSVRHLRRCLALEKLLYDARTDVVVCGHVHAYECTLPLYKNAQDPYGMVHLTKPTTCPSLILFLVLPSRPFMNHPSNQLIPPSRHLFSLVTFHSHSNPPFPSPPSPHSSLPISFPPFPSTLGAVFSPPSLRGRPSTRQYMGLGCRQWEGAPARARRSEGGGGTTMQWGWWHMRSLSYRTLAARHLCSAVGHGVKEVEVEKVEWRRWRNRNHLLSRFVKRPDPSRPAAIAAMWEVEGVATLAN
ncbi:unnamed protein product, partial [Closterium sp. NIES-65]